MNPIAEEENKKYNGVKIFHEGFPADSEVQNMVQYAYDIGGFDLVKLIECENGGRDVRKQSMIYNNGIREPSYGLCQIHKKYHPNIINDKRFREDWKTQIDYCKQLQKEGTLFYGPERLVNGVKCYIYVEDRFTFIE